MGSAPSASGKLPFDDDNDGTNMAISTLMGSSEI